ncbi:hypothetical protein CEXT_598941 [Caerostris extrusa]|uniref:Uncharacterized protein n=1 Tax=Caerostris extrusa TaxID=172846 RepID=A0AAV4YD58_CAEEX|nr:hypothetical protein CEXT_598941 [Caerostris extrusa]
MDKVYNYETEVQLLRHEFRSVDFGIYGRFIQGQGCHFSKHVSVQRRDIPIGRVSSGRGRLVLWWFATIPADLLASDIPLNQILLICHSEPTNL